MEGDMGVNAPTRVSPEKGEKICFREMQVTYKDTGKEAPKEQILSPATLVGVFKYLEDETREKLICVHLDVNNHINGYEVVAVGSIRECDIHFPEIFKTTLLTNSARIILIHNHPSGNPEPSIEDFAVTKQLKKAGEILGIDVLDHIIIGRESFTSLKDSGFYPSE